MRHLDEVLSRTCRDACDAIAMNRKRRRPTRTVHDTTAQRLSARLQQAKYEAAVEISEPVVRACNDPSIPAQVRLLI